MTFTEQDLRVALRADAGSEPLDTDAGWTDVARRRARGRRDRRLILAAAAVMVVAVATTTTVVVLAEDDDGVRLTPPPVTTPSTTSARPPSTPAILPEPALNGCSASRWPMPGNTPEEIDSFATLGTPEATAAYVAAKATACDYDALRTAMAEDFVWSPTSAPGADAAIEAWRLQEANGQPIMYNVVRLLRTAERDYDPASGITTWKGSPQTPGSNEGLEIDDGGIWLSYTLP